MSIQYHFGLTRLYSTLITKRQFGPWEKEQQQTNYGGSWPTMNWKWMTWSISKPFSCAPINELHLPLHFARRSTTHPMSSPSGLLISANSHTRATVIQRSPCLVYRAAPKFSRWSSTILWTITPNVSSPVLHQQVKAAIKYTFATGFL